MDALNDVAFHELQKRILEADNKGFADIAQRLRAEINRRVLEGHVRPQKEIVANDARENALNALEQARLRLTNAKAAPIDANSKLRIAVAAQALTDAERIATQYTKTTTGDWLE